MGLETQRRRRGHNFFPPQSIAKKVPAIGTTDGLGEDALVHLHFFTASADWYVTEWDQATGEAFGWAELLPGCGEWGYMSLPELEAVYVHPFTIVERDLYWDVRPMREVLAARRYH
jgi:hypothetical protein